MESVWAKLGIILATAASSYFIGEHGTQPQSNVDTAITAMAEQLKACYAKKD
jgi:hypothetical protein